MRPGRAILGPGLPAFLGLMLEGVVVDWSGVYMPTVVGASAAYAAVGVLWGWRNARL